MSVRVIIAVILRKCVSRTLVSDQTSLASASFRAFSSVGARSSRLFFCGVQKIARVSVTFTFLKVRTDRRVLILAVGGAPIAFSL